MVSPMHVGLAGEHVALQTAQALVQGGSECRVRMLFDAQQPCCEAEGVATTEHIWKQL